ncbi:transmembrane protease serine 11G-like [Pelobates fuscus]|uniref:transmembrane protease serine 11G-like n=1 Tax=Pelobates fuscus TaxID=191477 RepID=UPI002FE442FB
MKSSVFWKIKVASIILIVFLVVAAAVIVTTVLLLGSKSSVSNSTIQYYDGSFRILNLNYTNDYKDGSSSGYKLLATQLQGLLTSTFENSSLKNQYTKCEVINLRPGSVIVDFVLQFTTTNQGTTFPTTDLVHNIFIENFANSSWSSFKVDAGSFYISSISGSDAYNLLNNVISAVIYFFNV